MANPSLPILRLHMKKRNHALIKVTDAEVMSTRVFDKGVFCWSVNNIIPKILSATRLFIHANMKNQVQTVEFDILRKKTGSVSIF